MVTSKFSIVFAITGLCLFFTLAINALQNKKCDCRGPTKYYEELQCIPVYKNPDDCCPIRYNCDAWKNVPTHKCLLNGHLYEWGERLREEDRNPCDYCACGGMDASTGWVSTFSCVGPMCASPSFPDNSRCYLKQNATDCCGGIPYCLKKGEIRPTCIVDGKTYKDGERFTPAAEPEKKCFCGEGYTGENIEPYCVSPKHTWCSNVIYHPSDIQKFCAPIYAFESSPKTDCNFGFRCQNSMDVVISKANETSDVSKSETRQPDDPDMLCHFGQLTMRIGDELNQDTDYFSTCMKCVCEVPPVPTCQRRSQIDCPDSEHGGL